MDHQNDLCNQTASNDTNVESVLMQIYDTCDSFGSGFVTVSSLVDYMKPFMATKVEHLETLKESLDPSGVDPEITKEIFYDVMSKWVKEFDQEESLQSISPRHLDNSRPLVESTPRKSFGARQMRVYAEAAALDVSLVGKTSFLGSDSNDSPIEKSVLEEQIKQLAHQSRKNNDELLMARSQLLHQEEQNLVLQNEIEKLNKDLKQERETNEALIKTNKTFEEMREHSFNRQKTIDKLKKKLEDLKKENQDLQAQNSLLDNEKVNSSEKLGQIHEKLAQARKNVIELQTEMNMKDEQLNLAENFKKQLMIKIQDLQDVNDNLQESNSYLNIEKEKASNLLQEHLKRESQAMFDLATQNSLALNTKQETPSISQVINSPHMKLQKYVDMLKYFPNFPSVGNPNGITDDKDNATLTSTSTKARHLSHEGPVPFQSPIKTSKFTFYNIDSPIAKCSTAQKQTNVSSEVGVQPVSLSSLLFQNTDSPNTPIDEPPCMYIVERTEHRKRIYEPVKAVSSINFDESYNEEEQLQLTLSSNINVDQVSLKEEIAEVCYGQDGQDHGQSTGDDWFNSSLRHWEDKNNLLVNMNQSLETQIKQFKDKIIDLNEVIMLGQSKEQDLLIKCKEYEEKITDTKESFKLLTCDLEAIQNENVKLCNEQQINDTLIEQLRNEIKENQEKLKLQVEESEVNQTILREKHKMEVDTLSNEILKYQTDLALLEEKFTVSNEHLETLIPKYEESTASYATLFTQNRQLLDEVNCLQNKYNCMVQIIEEHNTCRDMTPQQKVALLVSTICTTNNKYDQLQINLDQIQQEKQKLSDELNVLIVKHKELNDQLKTQVTSLPPNKISHDRAQIKMEKLRAQIDHLNDCLKKEKSKQYCLQQEIEYLKEDKRKIEEKEEVKMENCNLMKKTVDYDELVSKINSLLDNNKDLRAIMSKFVQSWSVVIDQIDSADEMISKLMAPLASTQTLTEDILMCSNDLQLFSLILSSLVGYHVNKFIRSVDKDSHDVKVMNFSHLARPISPDSPNLGSFDFVSSVNEIEDHQLNEKHENTTSTTLNVNNILENPDGCDADVDGNLESDIDYDDLHNPIDDLHKLYSTESQAFLMSSIRLEEPENETKPDLGQFVDEFVLMFMVDCSGHKNRLQGQFEVIQNHVTDLIKHLTTFSTLGINMKQRKFCMGSIVHNLFELTKSIELYGAIQQEIKSSQNISKLIEYITTLRECYANKMAGVPIRDPRQNLICVNSSPSCSNAIQDCTTTSNRIMLLLHTMRPGNVVRLVGVAALAFLLYYFSQRFSTTNPSNENCRTTQSHCSSSWFQLLSACFGQLHQNVHRPI